MNSAVILEFASNIFQPRETASSYREASRHRPFQGALGVGVAVTHAAT
jgi:hypothetical protein